MKERHGSHRRQSFAGVSSRQHILYVEDNLANYSVAKLHLGTRHKLLIARNAREACMCLRTQHSQLTVILMDIELRGSELDGIELTRLIRGKLEAEKIPDFARSVPVLGVPIVFATAFNSRYSAEELEAAGGNLCISKPVDFNRLEKILASLTQGRSED